MGIGTNVSLTVPWLQGFHQMWHMQESLVHCYQAQKKMKSISQYVTTHTCYKHVPSDNKIYITVTMYSMITRLITLHFTSYPIAHVLHDNKIDIIKKKKNIYIYIYIYVLLMSTLRTLVQQYLIHY
ncbi:hypothetical protein GYH30_037419 [Glycine max]|uniref:Uncharacterized protein n=1 Tax=Glycine max TaxID=3847 RepID=A0A0R0H270_SOYBN|nr:hypothetical protein GYH30_037419 [Glycine max]